MEKLNFAVIGAGHFGKNYARVLQRIPHARLAALTYNKAGSGEALRKSVLGSVIVTDDIDMVLQNKEIDCAVIATPPSTHFDIAKKAVENGKHVLLEKPMVADIGQAEKLREVVEKSPVTFMVGHQYAYHDCVNYLKHEGFGLGFGKARFYFGEHFYPGPVRHDVGCLEDAGTHQLSVIQHLFNPGSLESVEAGSAGFGSKGNRDFVWARLSFQSGLEAMFSLCWLAPEKTRRSIIVGTGKYAVFDDTAKSGKIRIYDSMARGISGGLSYFAENTAGIKPFIPKITEREPLLNEVNHFIACIRAKKTPDTGMEKSFQIMEWLDKISKAMGN